MIPKDTFPKLIIKAALTGMIPMKEDTPHVPITPKEIAEDAYRVYKAGASCVHIHARDGTGLPTYKAEVFREIFGLILERCPDIIICATTSGRVDPQVEHRAEVLSLKPEMASLTVGSMNFPKYASVNPPSTILELAKIMVQNDIMPELEIFEPGFINYALYLHGKGILRSPLHFNMLLGSLGSVPAGLRDLTYLVDSLPEGSVWSATGIGRYQTQINVGAMLMGGHVRVGVEDSLYYQYPNKELATNEALVKRIVRIAEEIGREIASPDEARAIIGLKQKK
jgi:3-keto-5-aminohexanoate cleavage enzyme